jgi:FMN phosphatase YigB (HAD superfamily)
MKTNIDAANALGMKGVWFQTQQQTLTNIRKMLS